MATESADDMGVDCDEDEGIKPAAKLLNVEQGTVLLTMVTKNCRQQPATKAQTGNAHGNACAYRRRHLLTARPQSKPTNTQEQQTWLAMRGIQQERYQKCWER